ncbi:hypothetical protein I4U23_019594 [Adineta vaga]|nr:hypothetical protein I4U23_019594 [Adineta vaga]
MFADRMISKTKLNDLKHLNKTSHTKTNRPRTFKINPTMSTNIHDYRIVLINSE